MTRLATMIALAALTACAASPTLPPSSAAPTPPSSAAPAAPTPTPAPPAPAATPDAPTDAPLMTQPFGADRYGFVEASSSNGRTVVLRRFRGATAPTFGHHGETADAPDLTVFDRVRGTEREIDDIIDVEPARRWMLIVDDGRVWLVDGESWRWEELEPIDTSSDGNRCLPPRQASFSANGARVGWVNDDANTFTVHDLTTRDEWSIPAKARLWRGWPDEGTRGATLAEVPADSTEWPSQRTSCACRWCNRFAASYGFYGWSGPAFTIELVGEDGSRTPAQPPDGPRKWHDATSAGCTLAPASESAGLERGPWQWRCP